MAAPPQTTPTLLTFSPAESAFATACHQAAAALAAADAPDPTAANVTARFRFLDLFTYTMVCARLYGALACESGPALRFEDVRLLDGSDKAWAWAWLDTQTGRLVYGDGEGGDGSRREEAGQVTARLLQKNPDTV